MQELEERKWWTKNQGGEPGSPLPERSKHENDFKRALAGRLRLRFDWVYMPFDRITIGIPDILIFTDGVFVAVEIKKNHDIAKVPDTQALELAKISVGQGLAIVWGVDTDDLISSQVERFVEALEIAIKEFKDARPATH